MAPATTRIESVGTFDHRSALETLAAHSIAGIDRVDVAAGRLERLVELDGRPHPITVTLDAAGATLVGPAELARRVADWFDLAVDPTPADTLLGADRVFARQVAERPGLRVTRFPDRFEAICLTIVGQQVSLAAARLFCSRLVALLARPGVSGLVRFPTASAIAAHPTDDLRAAIGLTGARAATLQAVAGLFADAAPDTQPTLADLAAVKGIGPWTLGYLAIRADTDPDSFPAGDAALKRQLRLLGADDPARVARWAPHRSVAACRLWAMALAG
ncbi:DNA-3-methyladenine glycosylase family protein [Aestuariimicrobium soli]|uniref:DNA-3-methyladenine glycosylase family protein n=1 Tax=Aestuariimicrobium soli TaxID=2035834 RepID=UPI003EBCD764